jgi:AraC family transcriptional regulator of adaptative response/methylated-DNA-[protein]-cysteine methyltransferase
MNFPMPSAAGDVQREHAADPAVQYVVGDCSLGALLVAATSKGVCAIALGDRPDVLEHELQERFPAARLTHDDEKFAGLVAQVTTLVESRGGHVDLPLDIRGTMFQQRVWAALRDIPAGSTVSYGTIATRLGMPGGARDVAEACAANELAVAIPCHRVVRRDGTPAGYRWGAWRKRALLKREGAA